MTESARVDEEMTQQLTVPSLAAYLGTSGWSLVQDGEALQSWMLGDVPSIDTILQLPKDDSYADFGFNLRRALRQLQKLNGWNPQQLVNNVLGARSDVLYVRAAQFTADGTIPIKEAQQLIQGAIEMVTSAARATLEPRRQFTGRPPAQVARFIDDDVRMGHTRTGSFVMTIMARLDDQDSSDAAASEAPSSPTVLSSTAVEGSHSRLKEGYIPPFQRRVMSNLATSLAYLKSTSEDARNNPRAAPPSVDEAISRGVSSQLCSALSEMTLQTGVQSLDLSFNWSPIEPNPPSITDHLVFDRDSLAVVDALHERLKSDTPTSSTVEVIGHVTRLERGLDDDEGVVTVEGFSGTRRRKVRLALEGDAYTLAVSAHDSRELITARGSLMRDGNIYYLRGDVSLTQVPESE